MGTNCMNGIPVDGVMLFGGLCTVSIPLTCNALIMLLSITLIYLMNKLSSKQHRHSMSACNEETNMP